ncbi:nickel/cobalt homeostasis protein [Burkholderia multivorans]
MKMQRMMWMALIAAGSTAASLALAQPHGPDEGDMHQGPGDHRMEHGYDHDHEPMRMQRDQMHRDEGPGEHREWRRGDRLPAEYRDRQYVIDDWREYHLSPPPRGYHWVGIGGDYLLVQIGSGIVLRIGP